MKEKIIEEIHSIKDLNKRESQNINDIVFIDNLQIFFGGESGRVITVSLDATLSGDLPGSTPIEFIFWALPDFSKQDKNDPLAVFNVFDLPKSGRYDVGITFWANEGDIIGINAKKDNSFIFFTAEVKKKIKSYYLMRAMENPMGSGVDGYLFLLSENILHSFIATYLLNYPEDLFKLQSTNELDLSDIDNFNVINKQHLFKRSEQSN